MVCSLLSGVLLCLDCSSTHRGMGVHLTFVRSLDLDEWTQSQIDAMRLGGNGNARAYFRKHGITDLYGSKTDKKYKSKAAQNYKSELANLVNAEGLKRGEGSAAVSPTRNGDNTGGNSLLANLDVADQKYQDAEAKEKLEAARLASGGGSSGVLQPNAKLANSLSGASKLLVRPAGTLGSLRKPTSGFSGLLLKKKGGLTASKPKARFNRLSMKLPTKGVPGQDGNDDDDKFEDIEETRKNVADAEMKAKQEAEDAALAKQMQEDMIFNGGGSSSFDSSALNVPSVDPVLVLVPDVTPAPEPSISIKANKDENLAKLKSMTNDFFSQM